MNLTNGRTDPARLRLLQVQEQASYTVMLEARQSLMGGKKDGDWVTGTLRCWQYSLLSGCYFMGLQCVITAEIYVLFLHSSVCMHQHIESLKEDTLR